ncbi:MULTISPECIES: hypothetical protein [Halorussus]|nr:MULTISPECIES: hypothetical protein [Halorussus]
MAGPDSLREPPDRTSRWRAGLDRGRRAVAVGRPEVAAVWVAV